MKHTLAMLALSACLAPGLASAGLSRINPSEMSVLGGLYVVTGSLFVITSPLLVVSKVVDASSKAGHVIVEVTTEKGKIEKLELPRETVVKANLTAGDKLAVGTTKAGGLLSKNGVPIAYVVTPENAKLTRSLELAN